MVSLISVLSKGCLHMANMDQSVLSGEQSSVAVQYIVGESRSRAIYNYYAYYTIYHTTMNSMVPGSYIFITIYTTNWTHTTYCFTGCCLPH